MLSLALHFQVACVLVGTTLATPGRVPKVYNALITSGQNLAPSKAFPVYQPVYQEAAFGFPFQPTFYYGGDFQNIFPEEAAIPKGPSPKIPPGPTSEAPSADKPTDSPAKDESADVPKPDEDGAKTNEPSEPSPPPPPATRGPIPLNEFGLPPAVLPLGHVEQQFNPYPQFSPYYPGYRLYDPFADPYGYGFAPYPQLPPVYRLGPHLGGFPTGAPALPAPTAPPAGSAETPPPAPVSLDELNYSAKDPSIPNVPPPPLPKGGLKTDEKK